MSCLYYENVETSVFGFIGIHVAFCVLVCHLGCRKVTCSTVNKLIAQQAPTVTVLMSCDNGESDSVIQPTVDEQPSTSLEVAQPVPGVSMLCDDVEPDSLTQPTVDEQSSTLPEPLPVPAALSLRTFYGTRKSKSTELKPVAVRAHATRLSRKPSRYND